MTNEIAVLDQTVIATVFTSPQGVDLLLKRIRDRSGIRTPDVTTAKGRASLLRWLTRSTKAKVLVDDHGKELVAEERSGSP